jgi:hypothetical protein
MKEDFLHHLWQHKKFAVTHLETTSGESIQILNSGQLLQLAGTGVSGSVEGINPTPTTFLAGTVKLTDNPNPIYACNSPINEPVYTATGLFTPGLILYYDEYGQSPVTEFRWFSTGPNTRPIEIDFLTGAIGGNSLFFC